MNICEEIEKRRLNFRWICQTRVNAVNGTILDSMKRAGCFFIYLGVESGSQKMLNSIGKKITSERTIQAVRECKAAGILCEALLIYSLPGESDQDRCLTFELIEEFISEGVDSFSIGPLMIYPGTDVEATAQKLGILPRDFSWSAPFASAKNEAIHESYAHTPLYTETLSLDDMPQVRERTEAMRRPLLATLRFKEYHAFRRAPGQLFRFLWDFTKVRSLGDVKERIFRAQVVIIALAKLIKTQVTAQR